MNKKYFEETIFTKILPATDTKGTRVKAKCSLGAMILGYIYNEDLKDNHIRAVRELMMAHSLTSRPFIVHTAATKEGYAHIVEYV